jgi:hypothetical protein
MNGASAYEAGLADGTELARKATDLEYHTEQLRVSTTVPGQVPLGVPGRRRWLSGYAHGILEVVARPEFPPAGRDLPLSDDDSEAEADAAQQRAAFAEEFAGLWREYAEFRDGDEDDEEPEIIRAKWIIDGAATLEDAARLAEEFAGYLRGLSADGWRLRAAVDDDYGYLTRDEPQEQETGQ